MISDFKMVADFFCTCPKKDHSRKDRVNRLIRTCNARPVKAQDLYSCKIRELDDERIERWFDLRERVKRRVKDTVYEEIFTEKFEKKKSYLRTSMETHQSASNYYVKLERIYSYLFVLACAEDLIQII